jgi:redox-sensitive bicupin YhaK (pirin superfamily)
LLIATSYQNKENKAPIKVHADINMYVTYLTKGQNTTFKVHKNRQAYLVLLEGQASINHLTLKMRDALEITEEDIKIEASAGAHIAIIEMAKYIG